MKHKNGPSARIAICLPQSLHDTLSEWAQAEDRPLTNLIRKLLKHAADEREGTAPSHSRKEDTVNESA